MKPSNKIVAFVFIALLTVSSSTLLSITPVYAQTTDPASTDFPFYITYNPALLIPEFTIQLADHSYDVPTTTTTSIDPYTGNESVTTQPGYHVSNKTIELTIPNQPHRSEFVPHQYGVNLYYDIRMKGHYATDWTELYTANVDTNTLPIAPNASYTTVSIPQNYRLNGTGIVDFQMRAINGTVYATLPGTPTAFCYWRYQASGWSSIQSVNLTDGSISTTPYSNPTASPAPTPNPTVRLVTVSPSPIQPTASATETPASANGFNVALDTTGILAVVLVILVVVIAALAVALLRKNRTEQST